MTSLASPEQANFPASFEKASHKSTSHKLPQEESSTPVRRVNKPRTRSAILKASLQLEGSPGSPRKRGKKTKKRSLRSNSPVIDLTLEDGAGANHSGEELPLRRVKLKLRAKTALKIALKTVLNPVDQNSESTATKTSSNTHSVPEEEPTQLTSVPPLDKAEETPVSGLEKVPTVLLEVNLAPIEQNTDHLDLALSPIKKQEPFREPVNFPASHQHLAMDINLLSLPTKRAKCVAFSDSLEQDGPSLPVSPQMEHAVTPRRSILKPATAFTHLSPVDPNNSSMWVKTTQTLLHQFLTANHSPSNPQFWQPGTIIQLEPRSHDLPQLVDGCVEVLKDGSFDKKFEVYATLNLVCRTNDVNTAVDLFSGEHSPWLATVEKTAGYKPRATPAYIKNLCKYAKRDMELIESRLYVKDETEHTMLVPTRNDPFESRALTQALKLISYFLAMPALNCLISAPEIKWFYNRACEIIVKPNLSKSLVSPYLSILKDCHFPSKKRKLLFESYPNPILEKILFAILNMKNYLSSSLINEKFIALRNLIQNFPAILAKHFHTWFPGLLINLCDLSFILYSKVVATGITTLLEAARNYLDNNDICIYTRKFLESPLKTDHRSWVTESLTSLTIEHEQLTLDYVVESLKSLLEGGFYKYAMDIWVGVTLLLGKFDEGIDNWKHIGSWLLVHKMCFNANSLLAKETALSSWKVIVYKVCCYDLKDSRLFLPTSIESPGKSLVTPNLKQTGRNDDLLRQKIRLLIHPFLCISNADIRKELVDGFHNCFLSILYNLLTHQPKLNAKYLQTIWDKIVQPVLLNFYFKKDHSNAYMHFLGLTVMNKLLKPSAPISDKSYTTIRCLSQEPISLSEIGSLNPRWVYLRFDKVLPIVSLVLKLKQLNFEAKSEGLLCFLDSIKYVTKKEVQVSDTTFDLIDNLPLCLEALLNESKVSYNHINRVILSLNDIFGAVNLVSMTEDTRSVVEPILSYSLQLLAIDQAQSIIGMWYSAIGEKKNLKFLLILDKVNRDIQRLDVTDFIAESLNSKKTTKFSTLEMVMIGQMFQVISHDFSSIAKKIIQQIVLLKTEEFEAMIVELGVVKWHVNVFNFFVVLMHDAPYEHLKQATVGLIGEKARNPQDFRAIVEVLLVNRFDFEISHLRREIVETIKASDPVESGLKVVWENYINDFGEDVAMLDELLVCAFHAGLDIKDLISAKWEILPKLKAVWLSEFGMPPTEMPAESIVKKNGDGITQIEASDLQNQLSGSISESSIDDSREFSVEPLNQDLKEGEDKNDSPASSDSHQHTSELKSPNATGQPAESFCIEISSDDRPDNVHDFPSAEQIEVATDEILALNSSLSDDSVSLDSEETTMSSPGTGKKRKHSEQDLNEVKRFHFDDSSLDTTDSPIQLENVSDVKQVSDSEESNREKGISEEDPNKGIEVMSSSEEKRTVNQEDPLDQVSFQGQSTANDTNEDLLDILTIQRQKENNLMSTALATVEENTKGDGLQVTSKSKATVLHEIFAQFDEKDFARLEENERYDLETSMMEFILRMRRAGASGAK